jgi:transcriptional regulator with XRE-family HTH domain
VVRCERCRLVQYQGSHNRCRRCYFSFAVEAPPPPPPQVEPEQRPDVAAGVRCWRQARGLTQKQLAFAAQLPRTYVSRIENGRILPGLITLERVAGALHVGLPALLERKGNGNGNGHGNGALHNGSSSGLVAKAGTNGNGKLNGTSNGSNGDGNDFMREIMRYSSHLSVAQRNMVLARVRQLAAARN